MGCDSRDTYGRQGRYVSIHAPTWGATGCKCNKSVRMVVSIHAPTWGATDGTGHTYCNVVRFNPRTHMGCDLLLSVCWRVVGVFQSTHPHGVRRNETDTKQLRRCFNPRTHMGCDTSRRKGSRTLLGFQSTHPHGVRRSSRVKSC